MRIRLTSIRNDVVHDVLQSEYGGQVCVVPGCMPKVLSGVHTVVHHADFAAPTHCRVPPLCPTLVTCICRPIPCQTSADGENTACRAQGRAQFPSRTTPQPAGGGVVASPDLGAMTAAAGRRMLAGLG